MRFFVTGATGLIGSNVVRELLSAGHDVVGLARSDRSADALRAAGAGVRRGDLDDLDGLRAGAADSDGVANLAFTHDFGDFAESAAQEARAIDALGSALTGSDRPLVVASGVLGLAPGRVLTEHDPFPDTAGPRAEGARTVLGFADRGVRAAAVRLSPTVHGEDDHHGFTPSLIRIARAAGSSGYVGDGANRWTAVHVRDAARLFRLALESAPAGSVLHAVGDTGIAMHDIATVIGAGLHVPVEPVPAAQAADRFGWMSDLVTIDSPASNEVTRQLVGWEPTEPGLLDDLAAGFYFAEPT